MKVKNTFHESASEGILCLLMLLFAGMGIVVFVSPGSRNSLSSKRLSFFPHSFFPVILDKVLQLGSFGVIFY